MSLCVSPSVLVNLWTISLSGFFCLFHVNGWQSAIFCIPMLHLFLSCISPRCLIASFVLIATTQKLKHLCLMIISCTLHLFLYFSSMFYCFFCINCDDAEAKTPLSDDINIILSCTLFMQAFIVHNDYVNWRNSTHS